MQYQVVLEVLSVLGALILFGALSGITMALVAHAQQRWGRRR